MPGQSATIYTIGHSAHELDYFIGLLKGHSVTAVADVRSQPYSRTAHFNREALKAALKAEGIDYVFLGRELGARREEKECYVDGQAVYERVAELPLFRQGLDRLARGAREYTIALMCAEKEPLDCHRTVLICRHLRAMGFRVCHILADGRLEEHPETERRLVQATDNSPDLFDYTMPTPERIERAYETRGKEIAYRQQREGKTT